MDTVGRKPLLDRIPLARETALQAVGLLLFVLAYADLRRSGMRHRFELEVEYWLFQPSDQAPLAILGISAWLLYRRRDRFVGLDAACGSLAQALPLLLVGSLAYAWAIHTSTDALQVVSLALNLAGLVVLYWGPPGLRALWLPIVFLLFGVGLQAPLINQVVFALQILTAQLSGWLLYGVGVPALVSGDQILRATQAFQVVEGCSGLRSVETLTMLTVLLIDLFGRRGLHAALLVLLAPLLAIALNSLRVLSLILNPHSEVIAIHNLQGIVILLCGLVLIYLVDSLLERFDVPGGSPPPSVTPPDGARWAPAGGTAVAGLTALACLLTLLWVAVPVWQPPLTERIDLKAGVDRGFAGWAPTPTERDYAYQGRVHFAQRIEENYRIDGMDYQVFVALADLNLGPGRALSPITRRPGSGWRLIEERRVPVEHAAGEEDQLVFEKGRKRQLVRHWRYGGGGTGAETVRTLLGLDRSVFRRGRAPVIVRLGTSLEDRSPDARAAAERRLAGMEARLAPLLAQLNGG